jgi:CheY-like chemotaxis protein
VQISLTVCAGEVAEALRWRTRVTLKILIADDSAAIHEIFGVLAKGSTIPFEMIHASNGQECLELLKHDQCNMAFIDVNMPGMTGIEAVGAARLDGIKTFVVLMSSNPSEQRLQLARHLKVYDFLRKPFARADFQRILHTYHKMIARTRALIVDDSATVRRLINKVVSASLFNIDVTEASDGKTALELCETGEFKVIVLDCNMPGLNGLETLERLAKQETKTKVIMMSGERSDDLELRALTGGALAFLRKPFFAADIDRELHKAFGLKLPLLANVEAAPHVDQFVRSFFGADRDTPSLIQSAH